MGNTRPSVSQEKHYRWKTIDPDILRKMLSSGLPQWKIAEQLGVSRNTITRRCRGLETARTGPKAGRDHPVWKGGRTLDKHGYVMIWCPLHPLARKPLGYVAEHRLVMEVTLGRYLLATEVVDHLDNFPYHNWPSNLRVFEDNADHLRTELSGRDYATSPRKLIPGAYGCSQKLPHCPDVRETLAQSTSQTVHALEWFVESHWPMSQHQNVPRRSFLRSGAWRNPFLWPSMD